MICRATSSKNARRGRSSSALKATDAARTKSGSKWKLSVRSGNSFSSSLTSSGPLVPHRSVDSPFWAFVPSMLGTSQVPPARHDAYRLHADFARMGRARRGFASFALVLVGSLAGCASPPARAELPRALREVPPDLAAAEARWKAEPEDIDALVWYGRRLAYEGRLDEALAVFGAGLKLYPGEPELLRHRGHRYLTQRRFEEARRDLERAAAALEGTPERVELDGAPNDFGVPRSTLHTNVWYHLGLAYHCLRRDAEAARAFAQCLALATNDDYRVAAAYWRALALIHLGRGDEARALAGLYATHELELMESFDYAALLALFAGASERAREELGTQSPLSATTLGYGVAMAERLDGNDDAARARLMALVSAGPSNAFGRIAAEVELVRLGAEP